MLEPIRKSDWNRVTAAHLLNRAGFGATPDEIEEAAGRPPAEVVDSLVDFQKTAEHFDPPTWLSEEARARPDRRGLRLLSDEERQKQQEVMRRQQQEWMRETRAWWLYRMRYTKRPLQEKLTLFWHGHFACSAEKVRSVYCLYRQNELFRANGNGNWRTLLLEVARDPAMLIYLDNAQNRKEHPNENFARELMELFTLGEGRYTEQDIKESARAFTGWTLHPDQFEFIERSRMHDDGFKRFFGQTGNLSGTDIIDAILRQPPAASFIARKLWVFFAYDDPDPRLVAELARAFASRSFEFAPLLKKIFLSREFYSDAAISTQIKSPVQWLVGSARALEAPLPGPDVCGNILRQLGQELFAPPNVKGWDGGYAWISTTRLLARYNMAGMLIRGSEDMGERRMGGMTRTDNVLDLDRILPPEARVSRQQTQSVLQWRVYQKRIREKDSNAITEVLSTMPPPESWTDKELASILHLMMSTPLYQLC